MMSGRLIIAIVSTIMEETVIAFGVLWGLPKLGVELRFWALLSIMIPVMIIWAFYSVFTFRKGTVALKTKQVTGLQNMIGLEGVVVNSLNPAGLVRVKGELWAATSSDDELEPGTEIIVIAQERLKLEVERLDKGLIDN